MVKNKVPSHIFRGYDIRAIADTELTDENIDKIIKAYATFLYRRRIKKVVVGYDTRLSSKRIHKQTIETLTSCGIDVIDIGLSLTQIVYFAQYAFLAKGAVMITASHNPKEFNGFKFAVGFSDTLIDTEVQLLRVVAQKEDFEFYKGKGKVIKEEVYSLYEKDILSKISNNKSFKIVIDACNGTSGEFLPKFLRAAGHTVVEQNCKLDGNFPNGTPDPTEKEVLTRLGKRVIAEKADVGFAYDCDGDRLGIVDEKGRFIWNDNLVSVFALDILDFMPGSPIVYNTLCSQQVTEVINKAGGKPFMWMTGHSFIKAKVKEIRALFGGELSGHFFFMDNFYGHDDGAYASIRLLNYIERHKTTLGKVVDKLPTYVSSPEIKFGCPDNIKFEFIATKITKEFKKLFGPKAKYIDIDGIRADSGTDMAIVRASQNGPYITVKFEAKTKSGYDRLKKEIKAILTKYKEVDFESGVNKDALD